MEHRVNCLVCGAELKYRDDPIGTRCHFCRDEFETNVMCLNEHYVCDMCHSSPASGVISRFCIDSESKDPVELAISLMKRPEVAMHGP